MRLVDLNHLSKHYDSSNSKVKIYFKHMLRAVGIACLLAAASVACLIHAAIPVVLVDFAKKTVRKLDLIL
jgi:hypothetical protein